VKFEYPKGWGVKWGISNLSSSDKSLLIDDKKGNSVRLDTGCGQYGYDSLYKYYVNKPDKWFLTSPGSEIETDLNSVPIIRQLSYGSEVLYLFFFIPESYKTHDEKLNEKSSILIATRHNAEEDSYSITEPFINLDIFQCEDGRSSSVVLNLECTFEDYYEVDTCLEFSERFFESIESKK
jgi:hypothetical protein